MTILTSRITVLRLRITLHGAVQGVGFRPYVYRLATELALNGWVINDGAGVRIEVEGQRETLERFLLRLPREAPPLAYIANLEFSFLDAVSFERFEIRHSEAGVSKTAYVLPDIATCPACLEDIRSPSNRRRVYPFTNCTNCGPRYSIVELLPYDRPNTTMKRFRMCEACAQEYENPRDRRFHAQPNACPTCGPHVELWEMHAQESFSINPKSKTVLPFDKGELEGVGSATGENPPKSKTVLPLDKGELEGVGSATEENPPPLTPPWQGGESIRNPKSQDAISTAVDAIRAGQILALKGLGGFQIIVDATNPEAVRRLRQRKHREEKPLALMFPSLEQIRQCCQVDSISELTLTSPQAPIVLLARLTDDEIKVADNVAPDNPYLGVMLPYTPLHHLLMGELQTPVVATSGNLTDEPMAIDNDEALARLGNIADLFLVHNRPIARPVDDSVVRVVLGKEQVLRRARGYAPLPISFKNGRDGVTPRILAVGAHLKNTVAIGMGERIFISQHIGDLETGEAYASMQQTTKDLMALYDFKPELVACDMHPRYLSTQYAKSLGLPVVEVQHHHAHVAACAAENDLSDEVLGIVWDGTGYGTDGTIWGGEFLRCVGGTFERVAHLHPFRLPSGDKAIKKPSRTALGALYEMFGPEAYQQPVMRDVFMEREGALLTAMLQKNLNTPTTTSVGRLFDAVASLLGLHHQVNFEGQAAMGLEFSLQQGVEECYPFTIVEAHPLVVDWRPMMQAILADIPATPAGVISARFHNTLIEMMVAVCERIGLSKVCLTGGVFQNRYLTERGHARLTQEGFQVYTHQRVPPNDGGISLGQVVVAARGSYEL